MQLDKILIDCKKNKGDFHDGASLSQQMKSILRYHQNWENLSDDKKEAIERIVGRMSDILNGGAENCKYWYSIGGYGKVIGDSIIEPVMANDD